MTTIRELVEAKLEMIMNLPDGWGYGEPATSQVAYEFYRKVLDAAPDSILPELEPIAKGGGIRLEWEVDKTAHLAEISPTGELYLLVLPPDEADETDDDEVEYEHPTVEVLLNYILRNPATEKRVPIL